MKTTFNKNIVSMTVGASLLVMLSQPAMARPPHHGGGHRGHGQPDAESILNRMDFDQDGSVTVEDFVSRGLNHADRHFSRLDADGDELISAEEFLNLRLTRRHQQLNDDLDRDALKQCIEETTGLTFDERPDPADLFILIDTSEDGSIDADEFINHKTAHATERFTELDDDENGIISAEELTAHIAQRKVLHEARKSCIDEQSLMDM